MTLYGCILLLCTLLGYSSEVHTLVAICGITLLSGSIANLMGSLHYAFERVSFPVIGNILEKGLSALVGAILLEHGASVEIMAFVLLGSSCANMLWQTAWVLRLVGLPCIIDIPLARKLLRKSIPFLLYGVLGVIYYNIDTILLSFMTNTAVIGWYGAAYRIFNTMVFLPSLVIGAVMYPIFSKLSAHSQTELKLTVEKSLNFLLFCGIPISVGLIVAAPNVVGFLYHRPDFVNTIPAMQFLAPGLLFLYINSVLTSVMICIGREKRIPLMAGIALVFNLGLNLLIIPLYQQVGAALVTSLTELLLMVFALIFTPRPLWPLGSIKVGLKALVAGLVMGLAVWFMRQYSLLAILPVAALVYFGVATLLGTISREDVRALYTSIRHKAGSAKAATEHIETSSEDIPFVTDEEMQSEQEFVFALGREMTNPALPAFKYEMTQPLLPTHRNEMYSSKVQDIASEVTAQLPDTPPLSILEDNDATLLLKTVRPLKRRRTRDLSAVEDNDATLLLKTVRPKKIRKTKDLSSLKVEEDNNTTTLNR